MEAPTLLLKQWTHQVKELFPQLHGHQQKSLALAVFAMILAGHAILQRMAEEISLQEISEAKMPSIERRLQRLIANERRGLACLELLRICQRVKWHDVLRISQEHQVRRQYKRGWSAWQGGDSSSHAKGTSGTAPP
jgi:hypothetical protein